MSRRYSFTKVRRILEVFGPALANAPDQQSAQRIVDQIMTYVQQSKLPRANAGVLPIPERFGKGAPPSQAVRYDSLMRQSKNYAALG